MKKVVSTLLALVMVLSTCVMLVTTATAATNTDFPKSWTFDEASLANKTGSDLLNAIGWSVLYGANNLTARVSKGALHLQNAANDRVHMLVCEDELLKEDFSIQYDFMYPSQTDLPNKIYYEEKGQTKEYSQYNQDKDEAGFFLGNNGTNANNTWLVQPRINGDLMNGVRTNGWVDTRMAKYWDAAKRPAPVTDQWFTVRIEYSSDYNVKVWVKKQGASSWLRTEELVPKEQTSAMEATNFISKYLSYCLGPIVDVYLDNISVVTKSSMNWNFNDASLSGQTGISLLNRVGWSVLGESSGLSANIDEENGALRLKNSTSEEKYLLVCRDEALKGAYTLQYDFMYSSEQETFEEFTVGKNTYSKYNSYKDRAGYFLGSNEPDKVVGTWLVQPRLYGMLLNTPKNDSGGWIALETEGSNNDLGYERFRTKTFGEQNSDELVLDQWFTVKIDYYPGHMVRATVIDKTTSEVLVTDEYSDKQVTDSFGVKGFVSEYLRFAVGSTVDICLDNISITPIEYTPDIYGYQFTEGDVNNKYTTRIVGTIGDKEQSTEVGYYVFVRFFDESTGTTKSAVQKMSCQYVYRSITFLDEDGNTVNQSANDLIPGMNYIFALHVNGVPMDETYTYSVIPYEIKDGKKLHGEIKTLDRSFVEAKLPKYDTVSGTVHDFIEFSAGGFYTRQIEGTNANEFNAYIAKLGEAGYVMYQERSANGNFFRTLYNGYSMVHLYYMPAANTGGDFTKDVVRIVISDTPNTEAFHKVAYGDESVTVGSMTFMSLNYNEHYHGDGGDNGLGVIFTNPDGSYVIVDGAWDADTETLYRYLKDNNKRDDGKIVIRAWIVTHPHEDHWGNFVEFAARYAGETNRCGDQDCIANDGFHDYSDVTLEYFVGQLNQQYCNNNIQVYDGSAKIRKAAAQFGAKTIVPQTGQVMYFGQLKVEFLYTLETMLTSKTLADYKHSSNFGVDGNEQSLIFRASFNNGKQSVLVTGDSSENESKHLESMYKTHLESDFVTLPHHGIDPTTADFYPLYVKPDYVLIATGTDAMLHRYNNYTNRVGAITYAIDYVKETGGAYYAADGEYRTFLIGPEVYSRLDLYDNDSSFKDSVTFEDFFK